LVEEEKQILSQATITETDNESIHDPNSEDIETIDTCKIKSDSINEKAITYQVSQFDPTEFKKL
jgi:hypothetical protein